ncbi:MAG TPA: OsmC family protein [Ohtaekwangia sp.]|nr:OsmC family protein [Ohtaekwangia sp.]
MAHLHHYKATTTWTGNKGAGTKDYKSYERNHDISITGKPQLLCSSDPKFRGDEARHNPEELLLAALSGCHMLWYLHLCAVNGIIVMEYTDEATAVMEENRDGSGQFREVVLYPRVLVQDAGMIEKTNELHHEAHTMCFIARSTNFPVKHEATAAVYGVSANVK